MCGLFGFIAYKKRQIDLQTFLGLGVENDSRGGHGCGIFIDGEVEYGAAKDKYFESFYKESKLLKKYHEAEILIGHDRKASVGGISDEKLQPVVIKNENGEVDFVLMHNGTIVNHEELATKYLSMAPEKSKEFTDSQLMAQIIYIHGFDVFAEYIGTGAFMMVDYRTPKRKPAVYVFKGKSKSTVYSKEAEEERPLYYVREDDGLWFSSTTSNLSILAYVNKTPVYTFPTNIVTLINENDTLIKVQEVDRTNCTQKETTVSITPQSLYHYYGEQRMYPYGDYDDYYFDDCYDYYGGSINSKADDDKKQTQLLLPNVTRKGDLYCKSLKYFSDDSDVPLTGIYYVNDKGQFSDTSLVGYNYKLYLFNGIPVFGEPALRTIIDFCNENTECMDFGEMAQYFPEIVYAFSDWPYNDETNNLYVRYYGAGLNMLYSGKLLVPFCENTNQILTFKDGHLISRMDTNGSINKFYSAYSKKCNKNHSKLINLLKSWS